MSYSDFVLIIDGTKETGFSIKAIHEFQVGATINRQDVHGTPLPFAAHRFLHPERLSKVFANITLAVRRQPFDMNFIRDFAEDLFKETFKDVIREAFEQVRLLAKRANASVRVRLHLPSDLQMLPWEIMYVPDGTSHTFLCLNTNLALVRFRPDTSQGVPVYIHLPLRILVVACVPLDHAPINVREEVSRLLKALSEFVALGRVEVDFVQGPNTQMEILQRLRRKTYHILHFIGHTGDENGPVRLILEDRDRKGKMVTISKLFRQFGGINLPHLFLLNVCKGASTTVISPLTSIAESLLELGVSAVIAHQFEISDEAAVVFIRHIYEGLAEGVPLEESISSGRNEMDEQFPLEAFTPVLFLHNPSCGVFLLPSPSRSSQSNMAYLIDSIKTAMSERRWSEAASYAQEALFMEPRQTEILELYERVISEEELDNALHHVVFNKGVKKWSQVLKWCDKYLINSLAHSRPLEQSTQMTRLKAEAYLQLAGEAEHLYQWADALKWYEQYANDPIFKEQPDSERNRITALTSLIQAVHGFCDPWLKWRG